MPLTFQHSVSSSTSPIMIFIFRSVLDIVLPDHGYSSKSSPSLKRLFISYIHAMHSLSHSPASKIISSKSQKKPPSAKSFSRRRSASSMMLCAILTQNSGRHGASAAFSTSIMKASSALPSQNMLGRAQSATNRFPISCSSCLHMSSSSGEASDGLILPAGGLILPAHPDTPIRSVMAPMVGAGDYPFRYFLRKYHGVDLTYTQMLHSKNLVNDKMFRQCHLDLWEAGNSYPNFLPSQLQNLEGLSIPNGPPEKDLSPNIVQLAGHDVQMVVKAATMVLEHSNGPLSGIDLNLGCPQGIARKGNYGAFLMESDFDRACEILTALRRAMPPETAVSAKIRLPIDDKILKERIPRLLETGINFMTVHGRTIHENKTKGGACHVERIALAVKLAHDIDPNFPVIANGGMETYEDVQEILQSTGAAAAMSSEALLETPNIFKQSSAHLTPRELLEQQFSFARDYLDVCAEIAPPLPGALGRAKVGSCTVMRGHLIKFLHRYLQEQTDMRDGLAGRHAVQNIVDVREWVDELYGRYDRMSEEELNACEASSPQSSWYLRHRKPDRRVHQKVVHVASDLAPGGTMEQESIEDRKRQIQERLVRLREQKKEKKAFV